jgi:8-oxo-dGTP pyrophosphatase MutT (NUDIX family)
MNGMIGRVSGAPVPRIEKVVAYIVRGSRVAVFVHQDDDDPVAQSGLQVPAGTCEESEEPEHAVLREAVEETGLDGLRITAYLGDSDYDMRPYADALHHRFFFQLAVDGAVPEAWSHVERDPGAGLPTTFRFRWLPISQAHVLAAGQGALLGRIQHDGG